MLRPRGRCRGSRSASRRPASLRSWWIRWPRDGGALWAHAWRAGPRRAGYTATTSNGRCSSAAGSASRRCHTSPSSSVVRRPFAPASSARPPKAAALLPGADDFSGARHRADRARLWRSGLGRPGRPQCLTASLCSARRRTRRGGADGLRLRRVSRLRRRDRRSAQAALPRRPGARRLTRPGARRGDRARILNASGCLDALAAPDVARQLDAFVTKTVTPRPRAGQRAAADRRIRPTGC